MHTLTNQEIEVGGQKAEVGENNLHPEWALAVEPSPDAVDGRVLLDELARLLNRFVVLPKWAPETLALWTLHTYAFQLRYVTTYLGIESPEKRCGKTTLLSVLSELVNRPVVAANISSPAFFRVIEEIRPTLLIDEADTFLHGNEELRGILNSGYSQKTAFVVRVAWLEGEARNQRTEDGSQRSGQGNRLARFSCWCPKVMAAIGRLPDTLADRCIVIRMQRKTADEPCDRLRNLAPTPLRRQCARFVLDHAADIASAQPRIPEGLNDRAADIWEPLLVLADLAGGPWPDTARQAAAHLTANAQDNQLIGGLLLDICVAFLTTKSDRLFSRTLAGRLNWMVHRPWAEMRRGKPVTELWLAQQLRPYGIRPRSLWIEGIHAKGYLQEEFMETFRRYIPLAEVNALQEEFVAAAAARSAEVATQPAPAEP